MKCSWVDMGGGGGGGLLLEVDSKVPLIRSAELCGTLDTIPVKCDWRSHSKLIAELDRPWDAINQMAKTWVCMIQQKYILVTLQGCVAPFGPPSSSLKFCI